MIFYLEDDENIRNLTIYTLEQTGHETVGFSNAQEMYTAMEDQLPDMFILDVMLPEEDGFSVLKRLRASDATKDTPVMMLTAKGSEFDKVLGLDAGADDYVTKPYGMMELVSRVNALFRRCGKSGEGNSQQPKAEENDAKPAENKSASEAPVHDEDDLVLTLSDEDAHGQVFDAGPIHLDTSRYEVTVSGKPVTLTRKEFQMLAFLMANKGIVVTRSQLLERVWGYRVAGQTRTVDAHIQTLRKKLSEADPAAYSQIETIRGVGYKMVE